MCAPIYFTRVFPFERPLSTVTLSKVELQSQYGCLDTKIARNKDRSISRSKWKKVGSSFRNSKINPAKPLYTALWASVPKYDANGDLKRSQSANASKIHIWLSHLTIAAAISTQISQTKPQMHF